MPEDDQYIRCTVQERILLHLYDYRHMQNHIEVPIQLTQQGIAQIVLVHRKHIPRALKPLIEKGLIDEKTRHVIGKPQRMKTYSLTKQGENRGFHLLKHLQCIRLPIRMRSGVQLKKISELDKTITDTHSIAFIVSMAVTQKPIDELRKTHSDVCTTTDEQDGVYIYKQALQQAWKDGKITTDERALLITLRKNLGISETLHLQLEEQILEEAMRSKNVYIQQVYQVALQQALADKKISKDEKAILEKIKQQFNIPSE